MLAGFELAVVATALWSTVTMVGMPGTGNTADAAALHIGVLTMVSLFAGGGVSVAAHKEGAVVGALLVPLVTTALLCEPAAEGPAIGSGANATSVPTKMDGEMLWISMIMSYTTIVAPLLLPRRRFAFLSIARAATTAATTATTASSSSSVVVMAVCAGGALLWSVGTVGSAFGSVAVVRGKLPHHFVFRSPERILRGCWKYPHPCPLGSVASYLIYPDVRTFR